MVKKYTLLNSSIEIDAKEEIIDFIDQNLIMFPIYSKKPRVYKVSYELNPRLYDEVLGDLKNQPKEKVRFFGDEYKERVANNDIIFLIDDDSVIVHTDQKFMIIGKTDFSKFHILFFIREAIYEGYLMDNDLILHSAAFSIDREHSNLLIGAPGAGKTTFLMESLINLPGIYISNDLVGVHNNRAMASIIPVRVAYGTLSRFNHQEYSNLQEKETYELPDFLKLYSLSAISNVDIQNIIFPHFYLNGTFDISKVDKKDAKKIITRQVLNFRDPVRPYLWVNELSLNQVNRKHVEAKLNNLIANADCYHAEYGVSMSKDDINVMKKVIKL